MTDIKVVDDDDFRAGSRARSLAAEVGTILATTYPGYRWRIEPHAHPTRPVVVVRLEQAGAVQITHFQGQVRRSYAPLAAVIHVYRHYSASSLKDDVVKRGGELLEAFEMSRRAFRADEFDGLNRDRVTGLLVLPTL